MRRLALTWPEGCWLRRCGLAQDGAATLADTVRDRGQPCAKVVSAERDETAEPARRGRSGS